MFGLTVANMMFSVGLWLGAKEARDDINTAVEQQVKAICTLRSDYNIRIRDTRAFLEEHPNGLPALGLARGALLQQIINIKRTRNALTFVDCTGVHTPRVTPQLPTSLGGSGGSTSR